jgi:hypothetical protein
MPAERRQLFHRARIHTGAAFANSTLGKAAAKPPFDFAHNKLPFVSAQDRLHSRWAKPSAELAGTQDAIEGIKLFKRKRVSGHSPADFRGERFQILLRSSRPSTDNAPAERPPTAIPPAARPPIAMAPRANRPSQSNPSRFRPTRRLPLLCRRGQGCPSTTAECDVSASRAAQREPTAGFVTYGDDAARFAVRFAAIRSEGDVDERQSSEGPLRSGANRFARVFFHMLLTNLEATWPPGWLSTT